MSEMVSGNAPVGANESVNESAPATGSAPKGSFPLSPGGEPQSQAADNLPGRKDAPGTEPEAPKKYKMVVNGSEREVGREELIDSLMAEVGEDKVVDVARLQKAAFEKFRQAKQMTASYEQELGKYQGFLQDLEGAPLHTLERALGREAMVEMAEAYLNEYVEKASWSPEKRRLSELEAENKRLREFEAQKREAQKRAQFEHETQQRFDHFRKEIGSALAENGLPDSDEYMAEVAAVMGEYKRSTGQTPSARLALPEAIENIRKRAESLYGKVSPEKLSQLLPQSLSQAIQAQAAQKIKSSQPQNNLQRPLVTTGGTQQAQPRKMSVDEYFASVNKRG